MHKCLHRRVPPTTRALLEAAGLKFGEIGDHVSRINPGGVIETDDGASIQFDVKGFEFDVKGFGLRLERAARLWSLTGASAS